MTRRPRNTSSSPAGPVDGHAFHARHVLSPRTRSQRSHRALDRREVSPPNVTDLVGRAEDPHQCGDTSGAVATKFGELDGIVRWYGTNVTFACGSAPRARAIESDVRSCKNRCQNSWYSRRGSRTVTSVRPPHFFATTSSAARARRRSGHSTSSSGNRDNGNVCHSAISASAASGSAAMRTSKPGWWRAATRYRRRPPDERRSSC